MNKVKSSSFADKNQAVLHTKFPSNHFLAHKKNMEHTFLWNTFFRRNLHRFAMDYLGLNLKLYQIILLYFMGINQFVAFIASRAASKSFLIAIYACCRAILYPGTQIVAASATKRQAELIISEKIEKELMSMSPMLKREIAWIKVVNGYLTCKFRNDSSFTVCVANDNARGLRSTVMIREEFRMVPKRIDDQVLSPMQYVRQPRYSGDPFYENIEELRESPIDIYISSSWYDNGHWLWDDIVDPQARDMLHGKNSVVLAFDESVILKHGLKKREDLIKEKRKQDAITWRLEFLNERVTENASAFFSYKMLFNNQNLRQVFYPRLHTDVRDNKKNKYFIPKQDGEIRVVSCDISFVEGKANDNSVFSCIRGIPETLSFPTEDSNVEVKQGYHRTVPYIESVQGGDTTRQVIRIRQLYEDFDADYIVLDTRSGGVTLMYALGKVMYDEERGREYAPLKCMNNQTYADSIKNIGAKEAIYAINATQQKNSDIAQAFRRTLNEQRIDLLISHKDALEEIIPDVIKGAVIDDYSSEMFYENPFLETQAFISETVDLIYEKMPQTGLIKVHERGSNRKDRYTSVSYGNYFIDELELDMSEGSNYDYVALAN